MVLDYEDLAKDARLRNLARYISKSHKEIRVKKKYLDYNKNMLNIIHKGDTL